MPLVPPLYGMSIEAGTDSLFLWVLVWVGHLVWLAITLCGVIRFGCRDCYLLASEPPG